MNFRTWLEAQIEDGFWTTKKGASGILPISTSGRICLSLRSEATHSRVNGQTVHMKCWGTIGGAIDSGSPLESAKEEVYEETGFTGPYLEVHPGYVFKSGNFTYYNFIALVDKEFKFNPRSHSHWETVGLQWVNYKDLSNSSYGGHPMHDGLIALLNDPKSSQIIKRLCNIQDK